MAFTETFISVAGAGAHDGTTAANAWTFAEAMTPVTGLLIGDRGNMIKGAYSSGAVTTPAGDSSQQMVIRGYNIVIGDLEGQGTNADGSLDTTNFPVLTMTGTLTIGLRAIMQNVDITGSLGSRLVGGTANDRTGLVQCRVLNTANNASAIAYQGDEFAWGIDCDFECSGATHGVVVNGDQLGRLTGCRIKSNAANGVSFQHGILTDCVLIGNGVGIGYTMEVSDRVSQLVHCTIYNFATAIQLPNAAVSNILHVISCHITDNAKYLNNPFVATQDSAVIEINNRTRDNTTPRTGIGDSVLIGEITTDTGDKDTDYVDADNDNFNLIEGAPGVGAAMVADRDCGGLQRAAGSGGGDIRTKIMQTIGAG